MSAPLGGRRAYRKVLRRCTHSGEGVRIERSIAADVYAITLTCSRCKTSIDVDPRAMEEGERFTLVHAIAAMDRPVIQ